MCFACGTNTTLSPPSDSGSTYNPFNASEIFSGSTVEGIQAIIDNGYPANRGGLSSSEAQSAHGFANLQSKDTTSCSHQAAIFVRNREQMMYGISLRICSTTLAEGTRRGSSGGNYQLVELQTPTAGYNAAASGNIRLNSNTTVKVENAPTQINIAKSNMHTGEVMSGVIFTIFYI